MSQAPRSLPSSQRRALLKTAAASIGALAIGPAALAQSKTQYPMARPIRLILTTPPGGLNDANFRKLAERFRTLFGQQIVVENRPGRGVASSALYNSAPDGYSISLIGRGHIALKHILGGNIPYDPVEDFTWIATLFGSSFGIYVKADSPYQSVADLVAAAKANPGKLNYGTPFGHGGVAHVAIEELSQQTGVEMMHIPFRGDTDAIMQAMRGELDFVIASGIALPQVKDGKLRLLAWLTQDRNAHMPEVPTLKDLGYPIWIDGPMIIGGPKGMDPAHVAFLENAMQKLMQDPEMVKFLEDNHQVINFKNSAETTAWARAQEPIEVEIVKRYNLASQ